MKYFAILFLILSCFSGTGQSVQSPVDFQSFGFTAVAHRGYSEFYPENTLIAIEEAFRRGIKYCEVDVAISSDGVYVLHHDPYSIARTTKATVSDLSWEELSLLDAGSWKASYFTGINVPSLVDALKVAQRYDAHLYLDIKAFDAERLANALNESGVDPKRMIPAITSLESAREFRQNCPDSGWVWFGADPDNPGDENWFSERVNLGCHMFELAEDKILFEQEWAVQFIEHAHAFGVKVWAYTINNEDRIKEFADLGIDGVETDRPYVAQLKVCGYEPVSTYPKNETTGNWDFKKRNLVCSGVGSNLKYLSNDNSVLQPLTFGNTREFGIVPVDGIDTIVAKVPAFDFNNGLFAYDNFMMEDSGSVDHSYSVIMDILIESKYEGDYISLIQTSPDNLNDADFFIGPDAGIGTYGNYFGEFIFDEWHRVVFVHDGNMLRMYIDGFSVGDIAIEGTRWTVFNNMAYHGKHGLLFFADDDGETAEIYVNALQLRNYSVSENEVDALGGANANGIPVNNKKVFSTGIANLESEIVDWEQQIIFIKENTGDLELGIPYSLQLSYGASTDISESGMFNFGNGEQTFQVTAADGSSTSWTVQRLLPVGINDMEQKQLLTLYPNPCKDHIIVVIDRGAQFELYDVSGHVLIQRKLEEGKNRVNTQNLPQGVYFYRVVDKSGKINTGTLVTV
ncbi:glycerophosphodiester phosphodiesterase family protein [Labilibaculum sp. K2S]|uniref:glycerophosphodiester phosphodiesterase family protein n=1 Tax=Labilibaculum sp. K2S TaxID=3056386 RepID=UPI0025A434C1|nr:glycerophosphodiester phosphodiesterase family protein [Labilibaculum sp. K2S]MDM8161843.1 glycerophosphodiester phosphodiesterase family protein [Labilibaculum sp. K2S]